LKGVAEGYGSESCKRSATINRVDNTRAARSCRAQTLTTTMTPPLPSKDVLNHIVDVHCHPTDSEITEEHLNDLQITVCAMATRQDDQELVAELARNHPDKVIPCFGYHPWFTHWISTTSGPPPPKGDHYRTVFREQLQSDQYSEDFERMLVSLPEPVALEDCIANLRRHLINFPQAMVGEVGMDRSARIPFDFRAEKRELTKFVVPFGHQLKVLEDQIGVAVELSRNVSLHSVKAPKPTIDLLARMALYHGSSWSGINIDLHSCGLSPEIWKVIERKHPNVFLSLSTCINGRSANHLKLIETASPTRLLVESDINQVWQCSGYTWDMLSTIAKVRQWRLESTWENEANEGGRGAVHEIEANWKAFARGCHMPETRT